ncbi:MAG: glycosyltransferase family 4 protein, partial [Proteobacteria bacterium]|nr:glycosyltransferase family 4 protein [Pseudomonadota bacterium]
MKIAYLIAGAGGMYCGSCMRDNRLAGKLIERGHDVAVIPLYTPLRTDEPDNSNQPIYFGGVNVYLQQKSALFRHTPRFLDRVLDAPALLRSLGKMATKTRPESLGDLTVSVLKGEHGAQRKEVTRLIEGLRRIEPALIQLPNLMFAGVAEELKRELGVPIVCTLAGEDIFLDALEQPFRTESLDLIRDGAGHIDAFVTPTAYYGDHAVEHFGLAAGRVHFVPMGIHVGEFDEAPPGSETPFVIGYLARICPEKGLAALCDSFTKLREDGRDCRLRVAGFLGEADRDYFSTVVEAIRSGGLQEFVDFVGEVSHDAKIDVLRSIHVLSVPTTYPEAKGLFVLEAMAGGVPVVQPNHGSFPELIEATGGGVLFDSDQPDGLAEALASLMDDSKRLSELAAAGRQAVREK